MNSAQYMLDTNIASYIIQSRNATLNERLRKLPFDAIYLSTITQAELIYGLALKPESTKLRKTVVAFLQRLEILSWGPGEAFQYGTLRASLQLMGKPLSIVDTMIAAHALSSKMVLVTNDQAFKRVQGLLVEDWTKP